MKRWKPRRDVVPSYHEDGTFASITIDGPRGSQVEVCIPTDATAGKGLSRDETRHARGIAAQVASLLTDARVRP